MMWSGGILAAAAAFSVAWSGIAPTGADSAAAPFSMAAIQPETSETSHQAEPVNGGAPVVYLTFDDGPHPVDTPQILEVLAAHGVRGTFFVVGSMVRSWPEAARQIVEAGHSIQLHSWRHDNLTKFTRQEFMDDIALTQAALRDVVKRRGPCLRPPYGAVNEGVEGWAAELSLKVVLWSTSGADWTDISAERVAAMVINGVKPGAVVLLHDGGGPRDRTVSALRIILSELTEGGYRFRPMCFSLPVTAPVGTCQVFSARLESRPCTD